jgi:hypothetical protein
MDPRARKRVVPLKRRKQCMKRQMNSEREETTAWRNWSNQEFEESHLVNYTEANEVNSSFHQKLLMRRIPDGELSLI